MAADRPSSVPNLGLTSTEAEVRLARFGPNEPAAPQHYSLLRDLWHAITNPLIAILLLAAFLSASLGERTDAAIIVVIIVLSTTIDLVQANRSQGAVQKLQAQVAPTATVLRDGTWKELRRRDVVPGDIVRLSAGDLVPADARLVQARDLYVQQSALTGESLPIEKEATRMQPLPRLRPATWFSWALRWSAERQRQR